jgi:hypothetical protein
MLNAHFVILGAIINVLGSSAYLVDTIRGRTRPNRVSFFVWTLASMLAFGGEIQKGVGLMALTTFTAGFVPLLIFAASFADKKAVWKLTKFDFSCGALSLVGLCLWLLTGQGDLAIFFSIIADGLASLPTLRKSYTYPESETWTGYFAGALNGGIGLLTVKHWTFASVGFPFYIVVCCLSLTYLIAVRPRLMEYTRNI